ncbi:MAG: serine/threonine-protein kinase [Chloroflexi bacterium]|jgi:outer membrane protein assembly factor BamB|nr:MAG: putative protein kinase [Chloroflexi bacterium OLB13]MBC6956473.1 protein kinase [Chloroflexota bacterium]MBV6435798.1 DNA damage-responsive serine/threonine-protein kinase RqkA [Anaerolineae bacterium]MDL1916001.1 serine/threonine-protein kinase [Anaerolineae bacterium CFX4]OQY84430.1 MAG: hypothetical protein B6D42_05315 [Anaerolineae bacterium UTCFX5]
MSDTRKFDVRPADALSGDGLQVDSLLMERYRIAGVIGGGGFGTVFQARDTHFPDAKRLVAIKEMITQQGGDAIQLTSMMKTFQKEANLLATLSHPAIPKIFDFFATESRAYLVMEYINGSDLDALLVRTRSLPIEKIVDWGIELCDVLDYLHSNKPQPIVFRDLKPANIMIDSLGRVRLVDFGIAKIFENDKKHTMIGTEGYSAPEQYRGEVTPISDIYGLGATLHHVITRKDPRVEPPFSFHERPIPSYNPNVPPLLVTAIEKSLSQKPEERFQTAAEFKAVLEQVRGTKTGRIARESTNGLAVGAADGSSEISGGPKTDFFGDGDRSELEARWKFKTEDEIRASPTIFRTTVFAGSYDTNMWAINAEDGSLIWKFPTGGGIASSPSVDPSNKMVYFGSEDHIFYALDIQNGRVVWTYQTKDRIRGAPRIAHNHVFFGGDDGRLYALAANNGRFLWNYEAGAPIRSRPFVTSDIIIFGADDGSIYGLELSGKRKWVYRAKRSIISSPAVDQKNGICYIGSFDGYLYALDANSGFTLWRFRTNGPVVSSPALTADSVYFGSADGIMYAVNVDSGKERWQYTSGKPIVGSPTVAGNMVYFGGTDNAFYCLDVKTGRMLWKYQTRGQITSTPVLGENLIVFGSMDNTIYALPTVG